jgi:amidase
VGLVGNTAPFNSTGHPALTIPVGFVPAMDDEKIKLPAGLQIVAKKFNDIDCLKVGAAWERAYDWKTL